VESKSIPFRDADLTDLYTYSELRALSPCRFLIKLWHEAWSQVRMHWRRTNVWIPGPYGSFKCFAYLLNDQRVVQGLWHPIAQDTPHILCFEIILSIVSLINMGHTEFLSIQLGGIVIAMHMYNWEKLELMYYSAWDAFPVRSLRYVKPHTSTVTIRPLIVDWVNRWQKNLLLLRSTA
jgi:hypothetical protein